jgi:hypothetical protein
MLNQLFLPRPVTHFSSVRFAIWALALGAFVLTPFAAETSAAQSESDFREAHPQFGDDQFDEVILRLQVIF